MTPEPVATVGEERPLRFDRRVLLAGAGVGGVLLGLMLLMTVCGGKGDTSEVSASAPRPARPTVPEALVPEAPAGLATTPDLQESRDPFFPVVTVPGDTPFGAGASPPPAGRTQPGAYMQPGAQNQSGGSSASALSTPGPAVAEWATLELKSTFTNAAGVLAAEMTVDGQTYRPATGETFSYDYRLERVDGGCVEVSAPGARAEMCAPPAQP